MPEIKEFVVAIELGSSKVTGIAGQKRPDGSISVLAVAQEESSLFIRKGVVYNIDKTAQCLTNIIHRLESQLKTRIRQVFVGVGGQSVRGVRNTIHRELTPDTIVSPEILGELMDINRNTDYLDQKILDVAEQEYKVDQQLQIDPVGVRASRLEANFLNILQRKAFFQNLNKSFETAGIKVVEMYLAPLELANVVLTEAEKRSGCALVDIGSDTTTVSVFSKNILRHLAVIPLGSNNITKDIASLRMEETDAEKMKLKYASAFTDNNDIDDTLKFSIDPDRQVESRTFIEIVEGRMEEIIRNVLEQIPNEFYDKLLGGIVVTGGGSNMKNIDKAFRQHTSIEKIRIAKFVNIAINSSSDIIKAKDGMANTAIGLLAKGYINCAGGRIDENPSLFAQDEDAGAEQTPDQQGGQPTARRISEVQPGVIRTEQEERLAEERARQEKEKQEKALLDELKQKEEEEKRRKRENSWLKKLSKAAQRFGQNMVSDE